MQTSKPDFFEGLSPWRVSLYEDKNDRFTIIFECDAEDVNHAYEQALDAYPNGAIVHCACLDDFLEVL